MTRKVYLSPHGTEIVGTLETLRGVALISDINDNGEPEYAGETDIDWNSQQSVLGPNRGYIYVCDNNMEWTFNQLRWVIEDDKGNWHDPQKPEPGFIWVTPHLKPDPGTDLGVLQTVSNALRDKEMNALIDDADLSPLAWVKLVDVANDVLVGAWENRDGDGI